MVSFRLRVPGVLEAFKLKILLRMAWIIFAAGVLLLVSCGGILLCTFLLGGSWVGISGVISLLIWIVSLLITPLIATHEPPSTARMQHAKMLKAEALRCMVPRFSSPNPKLRHKPYAPKTLKPYTRKL